MHVSLKVAAGVALGAALAAPTLAVTPGSLQMESNVTAFEYMTGLNYESARNWDTSSLRTLPGDTFTAGVFGQNTLAAHSLDGGPDTFTYAPGLESGGAHSWSGADTLYNARLVNPTTLVVAAFTEDGSDWLASGLDPLDGGGNMTRLRMDVGSFAAGLDPIGGTGMQYVSAQMVLLSGGAASFSTGSVFVDGGASGLTGSAIISGVDGQNIDEVQMIFTLAPTPGAASLLGLAGLVATRRRR